MIAPTALALIVTNFAEGQPRNRAMSVLAAMSGAGAAVGLIAGGLLTSYLSWRWVLFVNVPIGVLTAATAPFVLAESARGRSRFDLAGAVTSTVGGSACPARAPTSVASRAGPTPGSSPRSGPRQSC